MHTLQEQELRLASSSCENWLMHESHLPMRSFLQGIIYTQIKWTVSELQHFVQQDFHFLSGQK